MTKKRVGYVRCEILDLDRATKDRWKRLAVTIKRLTNCYWRTWLLAHVEAKTSARVRQHFADLRAWYEGKHKGVKPFCEVKCHPPEIRERIRQTIKEEYGEINERCVSLAMHKLEQQAFKMRSSKGSYPRWMRILADDGEFPNYSSPLPIPFDKGNSEIIVPANDDEHFRAWVRVDRIARSEKTNATSTKDEFRLKTRGDARKAAILWKIVKGDEYRFAGSDLVYLESKDKWFAHICYQKLKVPKPKLDPKRAAFLRPAKMRPWWLRIDGYHHYMGGRTGSFVGHVRRQLLTDRWDRQESYQYASSARKGHGRDRAVGRIYKLKTRWKDFVKTTNQQLVHDVIDKCVEEGCGRLVYFQPSGRKREDRFLHIAGKVPGRRDNSGWDWSQVEAFLASKCHELGIEFEARKAG